jgi:predicted branched-subunit amino acid permease
MTRSLEKSAFWTGVVDVLPFIVMVVPFATLFGVVAIEAGLSLAQTLSFSIMVIAGASQFAARQPWPSTYGWPCILPLWHRIWAGRLCCSAPSLAI